MELEVILDELKVNQMELEVNLEKSGHQFVEIGRFFMEMEVNL